MNPAIVAVLMALAGGLGSVLRFEVDAFITSRWGGTMPIATATINILGSGFLGWLTTFTTAHTGLADLKFILGTGLAGGFTTFSTAMVEGAKLTSPVAADGSRAPVSPKGIVRAATHAIVMLFLSMMAAYAGMA